MEERGIQVFQFEGTKRVGVVMISDTPWWIAKDVCVILELSDVSKTMDRVDDDEKLIRKLFVSGQNRDTWLINESGLYSLIMRSNKPEAKRFRKWVTSEVLPAINRHGTYVDPALLDNWLDEPDKMIEALQALKKERAIRRAVESKLETTKVELDEKTVQLDESKDWFTVKRVAALNSMDWQDLSWRALKATSNYLGYDIKKIFDANYGSVNAYHIDVWRQEYPALDYSE